MELVTTEYCNSNLRLRDALDIHLLSSLHEYSVV